MPTLEEISYRLTQLEQSSGSVSKLSSDIDELRMQIGLLRGGGGLLETQGSVTGYNEVTPQTSPASGTFVGQAGLLLAGPGIAFQRAANTPFLRMKIAGAFMNADYVVDSNGSGTHLTLFGVSGALAAALATGLSKSIWICTTHSETVTTQQSYAGFAANQTITVASLGVAVATINVNSLSGAALMKFTSNSPSTAWLHFRDFNLAKNVSSTDPIFESQSGVTMPNIRLTRVGFIGATTWSFITDLANSNTASPQALIMDGCFGNSVASCVRTTFNTPAAASYFAMKWCELGGLATIMQRDTEAAVEYGGSNVNDPGVLIENNLLRISNYAWKKTYVAPFNFNGNLVFHSGTAPLLTLGSASATVTSKSATVCGNYYYGSIVGCSFVLVQNTTGPCTDITITGNAINGPGSGTAITAPASTGCSFDPNGFTGWTTNFAGAGHTDFYSTLTVAGSITGYVKTDGTTPLTANWNAGQFKITAASLQLVDANFLLSEVPGASTTPGKTTIGGSNVNDGGGVIHATRYFVTAGTYTAANVYLSQGGPAGPTSVAIYSDVAGSPGTMLFLSSQLNFAGAAGWQSYAFTTPILMSSGYYWLAVNGYDGFGRSWTYYYDAGAAGTGRKVASAWGVWPPATFPAGGSVTDNYSIYLSGTGSDPTLQVDTSASISYSRVNTRYTIATGTSRIEFDTSGLRGTGYAAWGTAQSYSTTVMSFTPGAFWRMGEVSGNLADSSGNANTATQVGTGQTYGVSGPHPLDPSTAITFPGVNTSYYTVATSASVDCGDTFTLIAWIKKAANGTYMEIIGRTTNGFMMRFNPSNQLEVVKSFVAVIGTSTTTVTDTNWHMVAWTKATVTNKLYIDGVDVTGTMTNATIVAVGTTIAIGRDGQDGSGPWNGSLADLVIINGTALTAANILTIYNAGVGLPAPLNTTAGDITGLRINVGNVAFTAGVVAQITGNATASGYLRVGSNAAPTNTTAGDVQAIRGFFTTSAFFGGTTVPTAFVHIAASVAANASARIVAGTAPTTPNEGDIWNDSTQKAFIHFVDGITQYVPGALFTQTADKTVGNTAVETSLVTTGTGTLTLPANFLVVGKTVRVRGYGYLSHTAAGPTMRLKMKLGATAVLDSGIGTSASTAITNGIFYFDMLITCRTTGVGGTVMGQGIMNHQYGTSSSELMGLVNTAAVTVDTTASQAIDITFTWGTADPANTVTCTNILVEVQV